MLLVQVAAIHPTCTGSACRANDTGLRNDRILHRIIGLDGLSGGRCLAGQKHSPGHLRRIVALDELLGGCHAIGRHRVFCSRNLPVDFPWQLARRRVLCGRRLRIVVQRRRIVGVSIELHCNGLIMGRDGI